MTQREKLANSFKCRASSAGKLATNPRSKTETLSETTKTFAKEWLIEKSADTEKKSNQSIKQGNQLEDVGIDKAMIG